MRSERWPCGGWIASTALRALGAPRSPRSSCAPGWRRSGHRAAGRRVYFAGDTGLHPEFGAIAEHYGPFDLVLLPIGAYEPRWFMRRVHLNPEDAMDAYRALCGPYADVPSPTMLAIHWGTFRLTDEAADEPPGRIKALWQAAGLPPDRLWVLAHGETRAVAAGA